MRDSGNLDGVCWGAVGCDRGVASVLKYGEVCWDVDEVYWGETAK